MADDPKFGRKEKLSAPTAHDAASRRIGDCVFRLLAQLAGRFLHYGRFNIIYRGRAIATIGSGSGDPIDVRITNASCLLKILLRPDLALGETYMDGDWDVDEKDLVSFLGLILMDDARLEQSLPVRILARLRQSIDKVIRPNTTGRSRKNASHHYDIGNDLYSEFLDPEMLYSCAFFSPEARSLEAAQENKIRTTLDRLVVGPGMTVLDIGCGWGAMTRAIAARGAHAIGITLADRQLALAEQRVPARHADMISYKLQDYRDHARENRGKYDRVVSIGMFEHVGKSKFENYFSAIYDLLKPGGRALVHSIVKDTDVPTNAWVDKYIFPGGFIPRIEDMSGSAVGVGLELLHDPFVHDSSHYAQTLYHWRERFNARFEKLDPTRYDERFKRMWNFYLAGSQAAFEKLGFQVSQVLVERPVSVANRSRPLRRLQSLRSIRQRRIERSDALDRDRNPRQG